MVELRKNICSLCGYNELIARTEDLKYLPPRFGFKQVDICVKCDALSESNPAQFNEYWQWAIRGTDPSIRPVTKEGLKAPIKARKVPKVQTESSNPTDAGAAVTNFDQHSRPKLSIFTRKAPKSSYGQDVLKMDARRAYVRGLITGLTLAAGAAMTIYS